LLDEPAVSSRLALELVAAARRGVLLVRLSSCTLPLIIVALLDVALLLLVVLVAVAVWRSGAR